MVARRVLVIEDESGARDALQSLLSEEGFQVRSAPSGLAGLECFREFHPDIVLCDYYLPDISGLQVLRLMRDNGGASPRFIIITAGLGGIEDERALRSEADAFLAKPIDLDELHAMIWKCASVPGLRTTSNATPAKDLRHA